MFSTPVGIGRGQAAPTRVNTMVGTTHPRRDPRPQEDPRPSVPSCASFCMQTYAMLKTRTTFDSSRFYTPAKSVA